VEGSPGSKNGAGGGGHFCGVPTNVLVFLVAIVSFTAGAFVSNPHIWRLFYHPRLEAGGAEGGGSWLWQGIPG